MAGFLEGPHRYSGRLLTVVFRTPADLNRWLPRPLHAADPHVGLLKIYQLKLRPENGDPLPPAFSQYLQVCLTSLAAPAGREPRHFNMLLWEQRDWSIVGAAGSGMPKKLATIELTWTFPTEHDYDFDRGTHLYQTDVHRHGLPVLSFRGQLGTRPDRFEEPPFNNFYTVQELPPAVTGPGGTRVYQIDVTELRWGPPTYGSGTLTFWPTPDDSYAQAELLRTLATVDVQGCVLRDISWLRDYSRAPELLMVVRHQSE
jgi:hypothetical protein